ncbi:hypothetical protein LTS18_003274, partial [Coniosporium uncinatum]
TAANTSAFKINFHMFTSFVGLQKQGPLSGWPFDDTAIKRRYVGADGAQTFADDVFAGTLPVNLLTHLHLVIDAGKWTTFTDDMFATALSRFHEAHNLKELRISIVGHTVFTRCDTTLLTPALAADLKEDAEWRAWSSPHDERANHNNLSYRNPELKNFVEKGQRLGTKRVKTKDEPKAIVAALLGLRSIRNYFRIDGKMEPDLREELFRALYHGDDTADPNTAAPEQDATPSSPSSSDSDKRKRDADEDAAGPSTKRLRTPDFSSLRDITPPLPQRRVSPRRAGRKEAMVRIRKHDQGDNLASNSSRSYERVELGWAKGTLDELYYRAVTPETEKEGAEEGAEEQEEAAGQQLASSSNQYPADGETAAGANGAEMEAENGEEDQTEMAGFEKEQSVNGEKKTSEEDFRDAAEQGAAGASSVDGRKKKRRIS